MELMAVEFSREEWRFLNADQSERAAALLLARMVFPANHSTEELLAVAQWVVRGED